MRPYLLYLLMTLSRKEMKQDTALLLPGLPVEARIHPRNLSVQLLKA